MTRIVGAMARTNDVLKIQQERDRDDLLKIQQERERGLTQNPARERKMTYSKSSKRESARGVTQNPARERAREIESDGRSSGDTRE